MEKFDVAIIGSGPGGYVAAIRCAQLGMKTALIEKYPTLGGTCLNVGCIPSKAMLDSSEHYFNAVHTFEEHGIEIKAPKVNLKQMVERKRGVVKMTCDGINFLMKKNKITVFQGHGSYLEKNKIQIAKDDGSKEVIETAKSIIATGSKPASLPGIEIDKKRIITSTEALEMNRIIPGMDGALSKELQRVLKKNLGFEFYLKHKVTGVKSNGKEVSVSVLNAKDEKVEFKGDYCLMSVGRKPYTDNLGLEKIGLKVDNRGRIETDDHLQTNVEGIYAIGDVVKGAMLAHKAEEEGVYVAETMAGQKPHINYNLIPGVVYTWPEVAAVGYTEEQLKEQGKKYKVGNFPFKASGRARASMDTDGFVKVLADESTDEILGVHMIGPRTADMIAEAVVAMEYRASAEDISRMSHAHPTFTESMKEACLDATAKRALHI